MIQSIDAEALSSPTLLRPSSICLSHCRFTQLNGVFLKRIEKGSLLLTTVEQVQHSGIEIFILSARTMGSG
jgi:hypothetical protein